MVNTINDNIEENKPLNGENVESFDEETYGKNISELEEQKTKQKSEDSVKVEGLKSDLLDKKSVYENEKRLILEITGEGDIDVDRLDKILTQLTGEDLISIKGNKDLIVEIIGKEITLRDLYFKGDILKKVEKEDLEIIKEDKDLILEITGREGIDIDDLKDLTTKNHKLTQKRLRIVKENKNLILEISGEEKINASYLNELSKITKERLENIKENKDLILEITGKNITISDLCVCRKNLSELTKEQLKNIKDNKDLILEITGEKKIRCDNLKDLSKFDFEDLERLKKNKDLILEIIGEEEIGFYRLGREYKISKEELENIKDNKDLILEITGEKKIRYNDLKDLSKFTKGELENIRNNKDLILEITGEEGISVYKFEYLRNFTREKLEKIKYISNRIGKSILFDDGILNYKSSSRLFAAGKYLSQLDDESLDYCNDKNIKELWMIVMVDRIIKNSNKIRDYVKRKQEYLENNNKLIDDSEFMELFGGKGKYGKGEINQKRLGLCYMYTAYEILKKMNYFDVLIKTHLKKSENGDGWFLKLPMGQSNGQWIKVSKNEIDKKFDIPDDEEDGLRKGVSINSDSPLGFKIMEIAYMKKELIDCSEDINQEYLDTGDVSLTGERVLTLEGYSTIFALSTLIGDDNIINRNNRKIEDEQNIDIVFDNFKKGLIVDLAVKKALDSNDEVKLDRFGEKTVEAVEKHVKILSNDKNVRVIKSGFIEDGDGFKLIETSNKNELEDVINKNNKQQAVFYRKHAYSLERCYIDKSTGEKRVWVVNPWHTGIKFDISLESAKKIFDWTVAYIDIDKLFPRN